MRIKNSLILILLIAGGITTAARPASAQTRSREYELKAVWLYHFGNTLVQWPRRIEGMGTEFVIGVVGEYPRDFQKWMRQVDRRRIQGKQVTIRQYRTVAELNRNYRPCHILFISSAAPTGNRETTAQRLRAAKAKIGSKPVLIASDSSGLAANGAAISFKVQDNKVKIELNRSAVPRGVTITRRFLRLPNVETVSNSSTSSSD